MEKPSVAGSDALLPPNERVKVIQGRTCFRNMPNVQRIGPPPLVLESLRGLSQYLLLLRGVNVYTDSQLIDKRIAELGDWRGETLSIVRKLIQDADPEVVEEVKWRKPSNSMLGVPVWSHDGIICTGETYKDKVKFTFAKGASLDDKGKLFNSSLDGNVRRAIDIHEGEKLDARALKSLIRAAVASNTAARRHRNERA